MDGETMKVLAVSALAALGVALSGCATVIDGSSQKIAISTPQVRGARCVLSTSRGRIAVTTPGVVKVSRSKKDIPVRCTKDGYLPATGTIPSDIDDWTFGNVLTAGLGAGVDAATGSINDYPDSFRIRMKPDNGMGYSPDQPADPYQQPYQQTVPDQQTDPNTGY
jgi:hypothetical protein